MRRPTTTSLTLALTLVFACAVVVQMIAAFSTANTSTLVLRLVEVATEAVSVVLAWFIVRRVPDSPVAPALAAIGSLTAFTRAVEMWGKTAVADSPWPGAGLAEPLTSALWPLQVLGFCALLLVFPQGLLPGWLWRTVAAAGPLAALLIAVGLWGTNRDETLGGTRSVAVMIGLAVLASSLVAGLVSVVLKSRRGEEATRSQTRWLVLGAGIVIVLMIASWFAVEAGLPAVVGYGSFLLSIQVLIPASVAVAVIRHDLFSVDRVLSDAVAVTITVIVASAAWTITVVLAGSVLKSNSSLDTVFGAFVTALLLTPAYRWIHHGTSRVFDRDRSVMLGRVQSFIDDVREGREEPEQVEEMLRRVLDDPGLRIGLVPLGSDGYLDLAGRSLVHIRPDVRLMTGKSELAVLELGSKSARRRRRAELAARAGWVALDASRLRIGLRSALAEVEESRARLASVAADERRRIERDLHDGAQQSLVAIGMRLRSAQHGLHPTDPVNADLDGAIAAISDTVAELRRIAHGLRPSRLDDGLGAALRGLRDASPIAFSLNVDDDAARGRDEATVTTAYFVVAEAVANTWKHAQATHIDVHVRAAGDHLAIDVEDDGVGGADSASSLLALRDRIGSVGGSLAVLSPSGSGTKIAALL